MSDKKEIGDQKVLPAGYPLHGAARTRETAHFSIFIGRHHQYNYLINIY
ncbi:hypothetical protein ABN236_11610 [Proteus sp. fly-1013]